MRYLGGKSRLSKWLLPHILRNRCDGQYYVEPFCGAMNVIENVKGLRIACDVDEDLISFYKALTEGYTPPKCVSKELYEEIRKTPTNFPKELVGFVAFGCSFGGKKFGGYATGGGRNHCLESYNKVMKQKNK